MIIIKNRWTGTTMHEIDAPTTAAAILVLMAKASETGERASLVGANLNGANLVGANLVGANLNGANLNGANLNGANLNGANLNGASLNGASLIGANLIGANLIGANLVRANLVRANLIGASLVGASLVGANLDGASLVGASLDGANLVGATFSGIIPIIADIDLRIEAATSQEGALNMANWHTCATTHCRAGWAIHLAGATGAMLESWFGPSVAGAMIYTASGSHPVPSFSESDAEARADIKRRADAARAAKAAATPHDGAV